MEEGRRDGKIKREGGMGNTDEAISDLYQMIAPPPPTPHYEI
jgi:hypothetical protein